MSAESMNFRIDYELIITLTKKKSNTIFKMCNITSKKFIWLLAYGKKFSNIKL